MVNLISYPFRLNSDGTVAKTEDGEDYYVNELINLILTQPGERSLVPEYGITDPVFDHLNTVELIGKIEMFGPPVELNDTDGVVVDWPQDGIMNLSINYTPVEIVDEDAIDDEDDYYEDSVVSEDDVDYYGLVEANEF